MQCLLFKTCPCGTTAGAGSSYHCEMGGTHGPTRFPFFLDLSSWIVISLNQLSVLTEVVSTEPSILQKLWRDLQHLEQINPVYNAATLQRSVTTPTAAKGCRCLDSLKLASGVGWGSDGRRSWLRLKLWRCTSMCVSQPRPAVGRGCVAVWIVLGHLVDGDSLNPTVH